MTGNIILNFFNSPRKIIKSLWTEKTNTFSSLNITKTNKNIQLKVLDLDVPKQ